MIEQGPHIFDTTPVAVMRAALSLMVVVLLAGTLLACSSSARRENEVIERQVRFVCSNGEEVEMRFFPQQRVAVLVRHGLSMELLERPSGSGFIYSNGPNTVRGKGDEITVEIGRMVALQCKAAAGAKQSGPSAR